MLLVSFQRPAEVLYMGCWTCLLLTGSATRLMIHGIEAFCIELQTEEVENSSCLVLGCSPSIHSAVATWVVIEHPPPSGLEASRRAIQTGPFVLDLGRTHDLSWGSNS